jgi:hypothetical protein
MSWSITGNLTSVRQPLDNTVKHQSRKTEPTKGLNRIHATERHKREGKRTARQLPNQIRTYHRPKNRKAQKQKRKNEQKTL